MCPLIGIPELQSLPYTPGPNFSVSSTGFRFPESSLGIRSPGTSPSNDLCGLPGGPWQAELKLTLGTGDSCGQHPQTYDRRTAESSWATVIVCLGEGGGPLPTLAGLAALGTQPWVLSQGRWRAMKTPPGFQQG